MRRAFLPCARRSRRPSRPRLRSDRRERHRARGEAKGERRRTHQEAARKGSRSRPTHDVLPGRGRVALRRRRRGGGSGARNIECAPRAIRTRALRAKRLDRGARHAPDRISKGMHPQCTAPGPTMCFLTCDELAACAATRRAAPRRAVLAPGATDTREADAVDAIILHSACGRDARGVVTSHYPCALQRSSGSDAFSSEISQRKNFAPRQCRSEEAAGREGWRGRLAFVAHRHPARASRRIVPERHRAALARANDSNRPSGARLTHPPPSRNTSSIVMDGTDALYASLKSASPFFLMAGPCVIQCEEHIFRMCRSIKRITDEVGIPLVFKSSFDKANRTSAKSFRGPGMDEGLKIHQRREDDVRRADCHRTARRVPGGSDGHGRGHVIQIPAFLCRQTDCVDRGREDGADRARQEGPVLRAGGQAQRWKRSEPPGTNARWCASGA